MDDLWTRTKTLAGTLLLGCALLFGGALLERFLNQPGGELVQPKAELRVPDKVIIYVLPGGYQDIIEITLADGSILATNGVAMIRLQGPDGTEP
jgi:hypothetical protein